MPRYSRFSIVGFAIVAALTSSGRAFAQQSTLTTLPEEAPAQSLYRLGPVMINPKLTVPEIGHDSNAFNDSTAPRQDYVVKLIPEVDLFADSGAFRFAVNAGSTFTYYHHFESERSIAEQVRGRVTARLSRLQPWLGAASVRSHERTTEIDARAKRADREVAAGVRFDVSPLAAVAFTANRVSVTYADRAEYQDALLAAALDRTSDSLSASLRFQATPLTTVTFRGYASRDAFDADPMRDSAAKGGDVEVNFGPEAVVRGRATIGFRAQDFDDPTLDSYRGLTARGGLTTLLVWRAMLGFDYLRDVQYSFAREAGYYVENGADVVYTQRIGGPFDVQVRVGRHALDYSAGTSLTDRSETTNSYQVGLGYALESGSRFGLTYELAERVSEVSNSREFSRRRFFASYSYEFWR